jgi:protein tyrosine phosphatase (PTP) superfamily phosphohydrolase (DUF442 family)
MPVRVSKRRLIAVAALVLVVAVGAYTRVIPFAHLPGVWHEPERWTEARPGWLYRSGQIQAADAKEVLREKKIDLVLDLTDDSPDPLRDAEREAAQELGIKYLHLPVEHPAPRVIENLANTVVQMELARRRGERVFVHCTYGHRRSATALVLYARYIEKEPKHVAYAELTRYSDADSQWSDDLIIFLEKHDDELREKIAAKLAAASPS